MRILGIETSCDETAVAVLDVIGSGARPHVRVLANVVASQAKLHAAFGGVVPHLAKREHQKNLVPVLLAALKTTGLSHSAKRKAYGTKRSAMSDLRLAEILEREPEFLLYVKRRLMRFSPPKIDAIAVTIGPGLAPALWVGVNFARSLAYLWGKPVIAVNHLEGHIYTNVLPESSTAESRKTKDESRPSSFALRPLAFPALCLIVSGGHTEIVLMRGYGRYDVIGETRDDAAGEAFDKVAKMLGLGFPGGPVISRLAERGNPRAFVFPRPMINAANFDFSFSGLKTAVLYTLRDVKRIGDQTVRDVAASFEQAVVDVLVRKTIRAARQYRVKTVMIGGGVAANKKLRAELGQALTRQYPRAAYLLPSTSLTGDNALMIALAGWFSRKKKTAWRSLQADANLRLDSRRD